MQYLVTDHEETRQQVLAAMSEAEGLGEVRTVASPEKLRELLEPEVTSCILVDDALEGRIALPIIQELSRTYPLIPVVLLSRARTSDSVVAAMDAGARSEDCTDAALVPRGDLQPPAAGSGMVAGGSQRGL